MSKVHSVNCECGRPAQLVDIGARKFWRCDPCDAWVGADASTLLPAGRLADAKLRHWKSRAMDSFNMLWKPVAIDGTVRERRVGIRSRAYKWLANELSIEASELDFAWLTVEQLQRVYAICSVTPQDYFRRL